MGAQCRRVHVHVQHTYPEEPAPFGMAQVYGGWREVVVGIDGTNGMGWFWHATPLNLLPLPAATATQAA